VQVILNERYSRPADVYSYAMVLFEVLTHQARACTREWMREGVRVKKEGRGGGGD
jgi:hypothetical protein